MPTITIIQSTTSAGQIAIKLSCNDLPSGFFNFSISLNYQGTNIQFAKATFNGSSSASIGSSSAGSNGVVTINGALFPFSGDGFATFLFDASGIGSFDATIASMLINGASAQFTDPPAFSYSVLSSALPVMLNQDGVATGTLTLTDAFFSPRTSLEMLPSHGIVTLSDLSLAGQWTYKPAPGFYGSDAFKLRVSDGFTSKDSVFAVSVSPIGTTANDVFQSSAANYVVDGGAGRDTLAYSGRVSNFTVAKQGGGYLVVDTTGAEGHNTLANFERLTFSDGHIALDISGVAGQAYRIYQAAFNRTPDLPGLGYWIGRMDQGDSLNTVAANFISSAEYLLAYGGASSSTDLVTKFYTNVLHRVPDRSGVDFWVGVLESKAATIAEVLAGISESSENQALLIGTIENGIQYQPWI